MFFLPLITHLLLRGGICLPSYCLGNQESDLAQELEEGDLEWVSGWTQILVQEETGITYIETQKALDYHTALKSRLLWTKRQESVMWANDFFLEHRASFWREGSWGRFCGLPSLKREEKAPWRTVFPTEVEGTRVYGAHGERPARSPITHTKEPGSWGSWSSSVPFSLLPNALGCSPMFYRPYNKAPYLPW